ncbi:MULTISPECIES: hypothetical protein [unclassified Leptospira]|uniref:hypothetical protein n=1 Tax=unclassified Leptospira TaxID=2633828 RepID=UPI0002BFAC07|nr:MULTISPECIES: hypothetical protein [unclassified Leptospira]EMJ97765.1 hypothetical protein LEP1GSC192_0456 [Leptospira sp. B5-022]MCR1795731.1 hypothetical protein [Leptospira sp. id769339]
MNTINRTEFLAKLTMIGGTEEEVLSLIAQEVETALSECMSKKSVLGIDIVGYSQYSTERQLLIPILFHSIYSSTCEHLMEYESLFFSEYKNIDDFRRDFIDTGDGGFQIFKDPIQSLIFSIYFQLNIKRYNSRGVMHGLRSFLGKVNLRYSVTYDDLYKIDGNFYGSSIINCARILSKDRLDRFLMDENTYDWFDLNVHGIENFANLEKRDFKIIDHFKEYDLSKSTFLFPSSIEEEDPPFISSDIQRIGNIRSKNTTLSIFSYHAQVMLFSGDQVDQGKFSKFTCTLGNLNLSGITD